MLEGERNRICRRIEFRKGWIGACSADDPNLRIGEFLISRGKMSREQLQSALTKQQEENRNLGASVHGWNFNIHKKAHFLRAAQEGIVFALNYGLEIMRDMGTELKTVKAGHANMFLSPLFAEAFATLSGATVELYNTDGSQGAARGAGIGAGIYSGPEEAFVGLEPVKTIEPNGEMTEAYKKAYANWEQVLKQQL